MSSTNDAAWQAAIDAIARELAGDLTFVRSLEPVKVHVREYASGSLGFSYGMVRYPHEPESDQEHESLVVFADRKTFGPFQRRYLAGFQFADDDTIHPLPAARLAELGD